MKRIRVPLTKILPIRQVKNPHKNIGRYDSILKSIKDVGLVEPLMIYPQKGASGCYLLMDGHLRHHAMQELGMEDAECIIAHEDESFTYNARISRLAPIQEHRMILKAVQNGVPPERIASALNISADDVRASLTLLDGIHEAATDLLKDRPIFPKALRLMKKVSAVRQIEMAELMVSTNNFTAIYAEALLLGTPKEHLVKVEAKQKEGMTLEQVARMEEEMESLEQDIRSIEESYGENMLNLTLARGYIKKLLENAKVVRFLNTHHEDILSEFETIAAAETV